MKFLCATILITLVLGLPATVPASEVIGRAPVIREQSTSATAGKPTKGPEKSSGHSSCGRGYVVGIWPSLDGWPDWGFWLSPTGPNWSNNDVTFFRAQSQATIDYDSGKIIFDLVKQAMKTGQMVEADYWGSCPSVSDPIPGYYFQSVQVWYP